MLEMLLEVDEEASRMQCDFRSRRSYRPINIPNEGLMGSVNSP